MKKKKRSRKTSRIWCVNCEKFQNRERCNAKYGSDLCKKNESDLRIKKGYTYEIEDELKKGIIEFYNDRPRQVHENPFKKEIKEFLLTKKTEGISLAWRHEFDGFILYFFPNQKLKKYDIFYNEKRKKAWDHYLSIRNILEGEKKEFKNFDRISKAS